MSKIRPFELALIIIFVLSALIGVFIVSNRTGDPGGLTSVVGTSFSIWGTVDAEPVNAFLKEMADTDKSLQVVRYRQIDPRSFESELVNAIAEGNSPELILVPHTFLVSLRTKLQSIPFTTFPERTFRDTYVDGASIFLLSDGIYGYPFAVDPLVMYWNRDLFSSGGLAQPPKTWESFLNETTPALTRRDSQFEITQSAVALGEYVNVRHAKEILAMLFLQAGSTMVDEQNQAYKVTLNQNTATGVPPAEAVVSFYTQFSSPSKAQYSWNRAKPEDRRSFLQGTLAMYFGMGSERTALELENANLNFDMAEVPQGSGVTVRRNYGEFYAFAIPRGAKNQQGAFTVAQLFGFNAQNADMLREGLGLAPVHRSLIGSSSGDIYETILGQAALVARGWLDPDPEGSKNVFRQMIESAVANTGRTSEVISDTVHRLQSLF